jgi:Mrp family chromosome partitioning ATPase
MGTRSAISTPVAAEGVMEVWERVVPAGRKTGLLDANIVGRSCGREVNVLLRRVSEVQIKIIQRV